MAMDLQSVYIVVGAVVALAVVGAIYFASSRSSVASGKKNKTKKKKAVSNAPEAPKAPVHVPAPKPAPAAAPAVPAVAKSAPAPAPAPAPKPAPVRAPAPAPVVAAPVQKQEVAAAGGGGGAAGGGAAGGGGAAAAGAAGGGGAVKKVKEKETAEKKAARLERQRQRDAQEASDALAASLLAETDQDAGWRKPEPAAADGWEVVGEVKQGKKTVEAVSAPGPQHHEKAAGGGASSNGHSNNAAAPSSSSSSKQKEQAAGTGAAAAASASAAAAEPESTTSIVTIDAKKVGILIGPKGATKLAIQEKTGVTIEVPQRAAADKDKEAAAASGPVDVTITGSQDGVFRASKAIRDLATKGYCALLGGEGFSEGHILVPPSSLADIIGAKGATIRAIQEHMGVHLRAPQGVLRTDTAPVRVEVAGPREKVVEAKALIKELVKWKHHPVTHPNYVHEELADVPSAYHSYIIGRNGTEIRQIQNNFKVGVYIPNAESESLGIKGVLLVGEKKGVEGAERYVRKIVEQAEQRQRERELRDETGATGGAAGGGGRARDADARNNSNDQDEEEAWMAQHGADKRTAFLDIAAAIKTDSKPKKAW